MCNRATRLTMALLMGTVIGLSLILPTTAQQPIFATNTPLPPPPSPTPGPQLPDGRIDQYALRLWLEDDLVGVLLRSIGQITPDDERTMRAVQLLQYELQQRFPGAPHVPARREQLLRAMLAAPRGSVDMRDVVRPYIQDALGAGDIASLANYNGFHIEVTLADLDGGAPVDAIVHTRYPADAAGPADVLYEDYLLALADSGGRYHLLGPLSIFPAAPFDPVKSISMERVDDLNNDSLEELAISVNHGDVNRELMIFGLRNGQAIGLVEPGQSIDFGEIVTWSEGRVRMMHYRVESPAWGCLSEIPVVWTYTANFFRLLVDPASAATYQNQDTLACRLYEAEPLFSQPPSDAIKAVEDILAESGRDEPDADYAYQRAQMTLAMLRALDGQPTAAMGAVGELQANIAADSWLERQTNAFVSTMSNAGATAVDLCSALMAASEYGACDIDQVLARQFEDQPVVRDRPIEDQLEERGLHVLERTTVRTVGRADREAFNFDLYGASWWTFAPLDPDHYTAERIDPPPGFEPVPAPQGLVDVPQTAYDVLLGANDLTGALAVIDNAIRENPDVPLSPSARYVQALCYDLASDRVRARDAYFKLWVDHTTNLWAQLAAAHLERR